MQKLDPVILFSISLKSPYTKRTYTRLLNDFVNYLGKQSPGDILAEASDHAD